MTNREHSVQIESTVAAIADEIDNGADFVSHADRLDGDLELAYQVQFAVMDMLASRHGASLGGRKVGFNSAAQMAHLGVDVAPTGWVRADRIVRAETLSVNSSEYNTLAYEPEIAVELGATFEARDEPYSDREIAAGIARLYPSFELVDPRGANLVAATATDIVAQDIFNAAIVLGGPGATLAELDLERLQVQVTEGDEVLLSTTGQSTQTPVEASSTMINAATTRGRAVSSGSILICGAYQAPRPITEGSVVFTLDQLGSVRIDVSPG